ncbi:MAG: phosphoglucosamine mutase, partial [Lachnospira sp.]|nr:phosphoglucosamine mutase [Lachnospira sp.]
WQLAKNIFDALGAKTYVIHAEPDGFNINSGCGSTHIESLQELVLREHLDAGFAFDGDADRCLAVNERGEVVTGDHILYIAGRYMQKKGQLDGNKVVTTVMSNFGLYKAFDACGIQYDKTKVGDKYVYEDMVEHGYRVGGEQSGHIIFSKYETTGDGLVTALKLMEIMIAEKKTLSQLCEGFTMYPQVLENVRVADKSKVLSDPDVKAKVNAAAEALGENGRILVRPSGTEPLIRVMAEASDKETCARYVDQVVSCIREKGYAVS